MGNFEGGVKISGIGDLRRGMATSGLANRLSVDGKCPARCKSVARPAHFPSIIGGSGTITASIALAAAVNESLSWAESWEIFNFKSGFHLPGL